MTPEEYEDLSITVQLAQDQVDKAKSQIARMQDFVREYVILKETLFAPNRVDRVVVNTETLRYEHEKGRWIVEVKYPDRCAEKALDYAPGLHFGMFKLPDELFTNPYKTINALKRELRDRKMNRRGQKNESRRIRRCFQINKSFEQEIYELKSLSPRIQKIAATPPETTSFDQALAQLKSIL